MSPGPPRFPLADDLPPARLLERANAGDERALGRLLSLVEDGRAELPPATCSPIGERGATVGFTGPPGVGKSSLVAALVSEYRQAGRRVGVVAIDPSSPFTGGAVLGDRVRMQAHYLDPEVFIRSMSTRGHLGGLASATPDVVDVLASCGYDPVLIETVGVGQGEIEIAAYADTVVVVSAPGAGDGIQAAKAGVLEIGDVFVVNKADQPGAGDVAADLRQMLQLGESSTGHHPPVIESSAERHRGIAELVAAIGAHRRWLDASGRLTERRHARVRARLLALVSASTLHELEAVEEGEALARVTAAVVEGRIGVRQGAEQLRRGLGNVASR